MLRRLFCLRHKKPPGASLPCSSSPQKVTLRLRCSLVNALTTLWLATNFLRKRARAQLFLSGLQFPYKIPAGEAQRDFPVSRGHPPRLFLPAFLPVGELRFCSAKPRFLRLTPIHPLKSRRAKPRGIFCPVRPRTKMPGCCRIRAFLFQQSGPGERSPCFSARTSSRVQGWVL